MLISDYIKVYFNSRDSFLISCLEISKSHVSLPIFDYISCFHIHIISTISISPVTPEINKQRTDRKSVIQRQSSYSWKEKYGYPIHNSKKQSFSLV